MAPSWISTSNGLAGRAEAEEMAGEEDVAGRRNRDELGQAFQDPEEGRLRASDWSAKVRP